MATTSLSRRPRRAIEAVRELRGVARKNWWRRPPFLPLPDRAWWAFRMETAYGDPNGVPSPDELGAVIDWGASMRTIAARHNHGTRTWTR